MSVSEWACRSNAGRRETAIGDTPFSTIGPRRPRSPVAGNQPRARGLRHIGKVNAVTRGSFRPSLHSRRWPTVARHAANLRRIGVDGLMLGLDAGRAILAQSRVSPKWAPMGGDEAWTDPPGVMSRVAESAASDPLMARSVSARLAGFSTATPSANSPFHGSLVYSAPMQVGAGKLAVGRADPAIAPRWIGSLNDDLDAWRAMYPPEVFVGQFEK